VGSTVERIGGNSSSSRSQVGLIVLLLLLLLHGYAISAATPPADGSGATFVFQQRA
jgi:hypothetical protein